MLPPDIVLESGSSRAVFDSVDGMRLTSLRLHGRELIAGDAGRGVFWWGSFVMAPWTSDLPGGRLRFLDADHLLPIDQDDAAIHGVARTVPWRWDGAVARVALPSSWPFGGELSLRPRLVDGSLAVELELIAGATAMPAAIGWHPWFVRSLDSVIARVELPPGALRQHRDATGRPTGLWHAVDPGPLNDGLRADGPVDVVWDGIGRVRVTGDGGHWIVFDDNDHGVCVEPTTGPAGSPDRLLRPGERLVLRLRVDWIDAGTTGGSR